MGKRTNSLFTQPLTKVKHLTGERLYVENTARKYLNQLKSVDSKRSRFVEYVVMN